MAAPDPGRSRAVPLILAVLAAALLVGGGYAWLTRTAPRGALLPPLPDLSSYPAVIADHLRAKHAAAAASGSAADIGALCVAYQADMLYADAERCYAAAEQVRPEWRWTYYRTLMQADRGGSPELLDGLRQVVAAAPDFSAAWLRLGDAEFKSGAYDRARAAWEKAQALPEPARTGGGATHRVEAPASAYATLGLARVALVRNDPDAARRMLEPLTLQAPRFSSAFRLLADAYEALGRTADARQAVARASRMPPFTPYADPLVDDLARESRNSTFLLRLASEADLSVNAEWSEYLTRRALEFDPDNPDVVVKLGRVLRTAGRSQEALPLFERYHALVPGDAQGLAHIGATLSDLGRFAEAEPYLRRALAGLDDAITHYNLALLLAVTGRHAEAVIEYERALARDPGDTRARSNLAIVLVRQGDLRRAAAELRRVLEQDPQDAAARVNLGLVHAQQGDPDRAERELRAALAIDPSLPQAHEALRLIGR